MTLNLLDCKCVGSDSLVKLSINWDQSPRNWYLRPSKIDTRIGVNPRGWSIQCCHEDVTISIMVTGTSKESLSFEHLKNWRVLAHMHTVVILTVVILRLRYRY
jgi:hypothetical protein